MNKLDFQPCSDHIVQLFSKRWLDHDRFILRSTLMSMLDGGKTTPRQIANSVGVSLARVSDAYETSRYDSNEAGEIEDVFGVSVNGDRPFKVTSGDTILNVCCALVSLIICRLSKEGKVISTTDPVSKQGITVRTNSDVLEVVPSDAKVVMVMPSEEQFCADQWNSFCKYVRIYESTKNAEEGAACSKSAKVLSIDELATIASRLSRTLWAEADITDNNVLRIANERYG